MENALILWAITQKKYRQIFAAW